MKQIDEQLHQQVKGKVLSHFSAQRDDNNNTTEVVIMEVQGGQNKQKKPMAAIKVSLTKISNFAEEEA